MAYRDDADLEFLQHCTNEELRNLAELFIFDKKGFPRLAEDLSWKIGIMQIDKISRNTPPSFFEDMHTSLASSDLTKHWQDIGEELQRYGANTISTFFRRGKGTAYRDILIDVAKRKKVNFNKQASTTFIEENLLMKLLTDHLQQMTPEQLKAFAEACGVADFAQLTSEGLVLAIQLAFKAGGFKSYQLSLIIVNAIYKAIMGKGITLSGNALITVILKKLTGVWATSFTAASLVYDLAGPAFRITEPAVVLVALLRKHQQLKAAGLLESTETNILAESITESQLQEAFIFDETQIADQASFDSKVAEAQ